MDRKVFFSLLTFSFLIFTLYIVYTILKPFLIPLCWAIIIGVSTYPLQRKICQLIQNRRTLAASIVTPIVVLVLVLPFLGFVFLLSIEATQIYNYLEVQNAQGKLVLTDIQHHPAIEQLLEKIKPLFPSLDIDLNSYLVPAVQRMASFMLGYSTEIIKNLFFICLKIVLLVIALFFIYRDGEKFFKEFCSVIPLDDNKKLILVETIKRVMAAVIYGIFMTCLLQGFLGGLGFWFTGLPSPILFGAVMSVAALIPVVGTALIWFPGAIYLFIQGEMLMGTVLVLWGALVVSTIDNLIRPFFISGKAKLSILVIALGVLGGLFSFGFVGIVIGPIILALFLDIFDIYKTNFARSVKAAPAGKNAG